MRPLLLNGHDRPITCIVFNNDGDLLFSSAKNDQPTLQLTSNGERIGTYKGHTGAVYFLDVNHNSTILMTASADSTVRLQEVETGKEITHFEHETAVRCCKQSISEKYFLSVQDNTMGAQSSVFVYEVDEKIIKDFDDSNQSKSPIQTIKNLNTKAKFTRAIQADMDRKIITSSSDGFLNCWDVETGKQISEVLVSKYQITNMSTSWDRNMIITSNADHTARIFDLRSLELLKVFKSDKPINGAAMSPLYPLVLIGGGQDARNVTTTAQECGKFETLYYNYIYENLLGSSEGHFGPINDIAISPDGKIFASGSEDGYVRLHYFDDSFHEICSKLCDFKSD